MKQSEKTPKTRMRTIPLCLLALAPENVRKTPPAASAQAELKASIAAHGLIGNLVARADGKDEDGRQRYAVVAGGRRLAALQALAEDGAIGADHPVPCLVAPKKGGGELSLAENVAREAMHPADQVTAFSALAADGLAVSAIAARFGVSERTVEQRLRLGNAAPELLEAYRAGTIDLETLKAFAVTSDRERQFAAYEQVLGQGYRISAWQVRRLLTDERVPAGSDLARFVGVDDYEAAGGAVLRDLFADEEERGVWLEDPALLEELAGKKLKTEADAQSKRWKWAEARIDVDWNNVARYGRINPEPSEPTAEESAEIDRLNERQHDLANMDEEDWTEELEAESVTNEARIEEIGEGIEARAQFRPEDHAIAGCIVTIGRDGALQRIEGLVRPEDMPEKSDPAGKAAAEGGNGPADGTESAPAETAGSDPGPVRAPAVSPPQAAPVDPRAQARQEAGVGVGMADDLRAIRNTLAKANLAANFSAAFDLMVFQLARSVFARGFGVAYHALDIAVSETADRPPLRMNDKEFGMASPGEAMLADRSALPLDWLDADDEAASFAAVRALTTAEKKKLFAACVARTLKGQLSFEHGARPETEATIARLGIDFAKYVRPTADLVWSRLRKDRILAIARQTLGPAWAQARAKYSKADLAAAMEEAFSPGPQPLGVDREAHAAALAWTPPGFAAFDPAEDPAAPPASGGESDTARREEAETGSEQESGGEESGEAPSDPPALAVVDGGPPAGGGDAAESTEVPGFLRRAG